MDLSDVTGYADTVREALDMLDGERSRHTGAGEPCPVCDTIVAAASALDALVAALEQAERNAADYQHAFTDANEAREQAERERDEESDYSAHAIQAAERRAADAETALREILQYATQAIPQKNRLPEVVGIQTTAREALLAGSQTTQEPA